MKTLLLTSDLRGHIENPAYYFRDDIEAALSLDMLMITQGWRRYDIVDFYMQYPDAKVALEDWSQ